MSAKRRNLFRIGLAVVFLVAAVLACGPVTGGKAVTVVINNPVNGASVAMGQEVLIDSTATANAGVDRVELTVNGVMVRRDLPPSGNPTTFRVSQPWTPTAEGQATISVVGYDVDGNSSDSATITLQVVTSVGEVPTVTLTDGPGTVVPPGPMETSPPPVTTEAGCTVGSQYMADVTIPDGTVMSLGQAFVKTWKVKNTGTCDWDANYHLVFVSGDQMSGPSSMALPAVPAGTQVDISVNLTAPATYGTHKGTWRIRSDEGTVFGTNLTVLIEVPAPEPTETDTPEPTSEPVVAILSYSSVGFVSVSGAINHSGCAVGDDNVNNGAQCFFTFDLSAIPDSATIDGAKLHYLTDADWNQGEPFGQLAGLGSLEVYHHNYGALDTDDYTLVPGHKRDFIQSIQSRAEFEDQPRALNSRGISALQGSLSSDQFQIRLQFTKETNGNNEADIIFTNVELEIVYRP